MLGVEGKMKGQSVVEYLLLLSVVGILTFLAIRQGGAVSQIEQKAIDYYHQGAQKIKGN